MFLLLANVFICILCVLLTVPEQPGFLEISNPNVDSLTLEWGPPLNHNGRLTGYTLKYQPGGSVGGPS